MQRLMENSLQICAHQVDQVLGQLRSNLLLGPVHKVEPDVILQNLPHQPVHPAAHRGQQHQLIAAIFVHSQRLSPPRPIGRAFCARAAAISVFPCRVETSLLSS